MDSEHAGFIRMSFRRGIAAREDFKVIGVGPVRCNAVNQPMIRAKVEGVDFITATTDCRHLKKCFAAPWKLAIRVAAKLTKGIGGGGGAKPWRSAAKAALEKTRAKYEALSKARGGWGHEFSYLGLGGGTGAAPAKYVASAGQTRSWGVSVDGCEKPFAIRSGKPPSMLRRRRQAPTQGEN